MVYTSQVNDGICDCCDGSDEFAGVSSHSGALCRSTCDEEAAERQKLLERLRKGLDAQRDARRSAKNSKQQWRQKIEKLETESQELQKQVEDAKAAQESRIPAGIERR